MTGDNFVFLVLNTNSIVNDLFPGRLVNLAVSFICDAIILGEVK